jgi:hypothetical protein
MTPEQMKELSERLHQYRRINTNRQIDADLTAAADLIRQMAEQEPVAYGMFRKDGLLYDILTLSEYEEAPEADRVAPLYAAPPAPKPARVPLTEQEIWDAVEHGVIGGISLVSKAVKVARAIEAAHGIRSEE